MLKSHDSAISRMTEYLYLPSFQYVSEWKTETLCCFYSLTVWRFVFYLIFDCLFSSYSMSYRTILCRFSNYTRFNVIRRTTICKEQGFYSDIFIIFHKLWREPCSCSFSSSYSIVYRNCAVRSDLFYQPRVRLNKTRICIK